MSIESDLDHPKVTLGSALRSIRKERHWSLADAAKRTGMSVSTLSKVENGQRSMTYDKILHLADALEVDISALFTVRGNTSHGHRFAGRRAVQRDDDAFRVEAGVYTYSYLAHELTRKRFTPVIMDIHATSVDQFPNLIRHPGDEFAYVLKGEIDVHTEIYQPLRLKEGESVFFDSSVGHAYVRVSEGPARIMCIGCDATPNSRSELDAFVSRIQKPTEIALGKRVKPRKSTVAGR
jgi:transcriptional regulator with XRE-family HTH domain